MRKSPVMVAINIFSLGFPKVFGFGAGRRSFLRRGGGGTRVFELLMIQASEEIQLLLYMKWEGIETALKLKQCKIDKKMMY